MDVLTVRPESMAHVISATGAEAGVLSVLSHHAGITPQQHSAMSQGTYYSTVT